MKTGRSRRGARPGDWALAALMAAGSFAALRLDRTMDVRSGVDSAAVPLDAGLALSYFRPGRLDLPDLRPEAERAPKAEIDRAIPAVRVSARPAAAEVAAASIPKSHRYVGGRIPSLAWPVGGEITSPFGYRVLRGRFRYHAGVDIRAPYGTPVRAAAEGTVAFVGWRGGFGKLVVLDHGDGVRTWYAHNRSTKVRNGQAITAGEVIAAAGSTGHSYGSHSHFELRLGDVAVDPLRYLPTADPAIARADTSAAENGVVEGIGGP